MGECEDEHAALEFAVPRFLMKLDTEHGLLTDSPFENVHLQPRGKLLSELVKRAEPLVAKLVEVENYDVSRMGDLSGVMAFATGFIAFHIMCDGKQGRFWQMHLSAMSDWVQSHWAWARGEFKKSLAKQTTSNWKASRQVYELVARALCVALFWQRENEPVQLGGRQSPNRAKKTAETCIEDLETQIQNLFGSVLLGDGHKETRNELQFGLGHVKNALHKIAPPSRAVDEARKQAEFAILDMVENLAEMESLFTSIRTASLPAAASKKLDAIQRLLGRAQATGGEALEDADVSQLRALQESAGSKVRAASWKGPGLFRWRSLYDVTAEQLKCAPVSGKGNQCLYYCVQRALQCLLDKPAEDNEKKVKNLRTRLAKSVPACKDEMGKLLGITDEASLKKVLTDLSKEMAGLKELGSLSSLVVAAKVLSVGFTVHDVRDKVPMDDSRTTHVGTTSGKQVHLVFTGIHYDMVVADNGSCLFEPGRKVDNLVVLLRAAVTAVVAKEAKSGLVQERLRKQAELKATKRRTALLDLWKPLKRPVTPPTKPPTTPATTAGSPARVPTTPPQQDGTVSRFLWGMPTRTSSVVTHLQTLGVDLADVTLKEVAKGAACREAVCASREVADRFCKQIAKKVSNMNPAVKTSHKATPNARRRSRKSAWTRPLSVTPANQPVQPAAPAATPQANSGPARYHVKSSAPCWEFQRTGKCSRDVCRFQHVPVLPAPSPQTPTVAPPIAKAPCWGHAAGHCRFGSVCKFSHDAPATTPSPSPAPAAASSRGRPGTICYQWRYQGHCNYGDGCYRKSDHTDANKPVC